MGLLLLCRVGHGLRNVPCSPSQPDQSCSPSCPHIPSLGAQVSTWWVSRGLGQTACRVAGCPLPAMGQLVSPRSLPGPDMLLAGGWGCWAMAEGLEDSGVSPTVSPSPAGPCCRGVVLTCFGETARLVAAAEGCPWHQDLEGRLGWYIPAVAWALGSVPTRGRPRLQVPLSSTGLGVGGLQPGWGVLWTEQGQLHQGPPRPL